MNDLLYQLLPLVVKIRICSRRHNTTAHAYMPRKHCGKIKILQATKIQMQMNENSNKEKFMNQLPNINI